ncbi:mannosyl-oligosaccharide 1,3-1,6-alpha-mannosidase activity protein [Coemansia sp. RSA 1813]|nr:Alpha-mannosidase 2 [Coemansia sp. RSA 1646]KAJ1772953.1 mannosyl-oligosaccharide 1,3-1,6-alpha-mannosidase activity protein [Coemansia sp. RSA 1843]KAJ2214346.1 mannosyl-oligosaccharide 1,3-1,6-alpha-mannosidase activity protein [Coemansia sp. RSA 487]KAJ2568913.1 mannosyl-oligosaccharide 1,3-1,6-alpha-mannosidase activity protein [Coemansia sp. RSA 1813]
MLVPRRYIRRGGALLAIGFVWLLFLANRSVVPWGKPSWVAKLGEAGPPVDRDFATQHERPQNLTLHIVAHSHSDIGWNYSFGEYYEMWVRQVLRNVVATLWMNRERKFTWGDVAFLDLWMDDEGDKANRVLPGRAREMTWRMALGELISRGQWEIVGGTYVSPDEGLTTWWAHNAIVDVGRRFVARELNTTTRVGWQIDPFGHARVTPHLLANTGYTGLILGRMDYRERFGFAAHGDYEFLWQAPYSQAPPILTHFLSVGYAAPSANFDFDRTSLCNAEELLDELVRFARTQTRKYPGHGHVLVMMGDDFRYMKASWAFACLDHIVDKAQSPGERPHAWRDMTLRYSTPSEYLEAIRPYMAQIDDRVASTHKKETGKTQLRLHRGDFYPYQDKPYEQYWSGFYTTRPTLKRLVRSTEQAVEHVEALVAVARVRCSGTGKDIEAAWDVLEHSLEYCRKQVAIGYHHDAVTGTCSRRATEDYELRLRSAQRVAMHIGRYALQLAQSGTMDLDLDLDLDPDRMEREIKDAKASTDAAPRGYNTADDAEARLVVSDTVQPMVVTVTNANRLSAQDQAVRLHVPSLDVALIDPTTRRAVDAVAVRPATHDTGFEVDFVARDVPPLGWRNYVLVNETVAERDYARMAMLRDAFHTQTSSAGPLATEAVLEKDGTRVRLAIDRRGSGVRMSMERGSGRSEVVHQLRQYSINPRIQPSGAYVMHSFMLMYAVVFYVFGGALCAGLAASVVVAAARMQQAKSIPATRFSPMLAIALGAAVGFALAYFVEQVASVATLNRWAGGDVVSSAGLAVAAFAIGYAVSVALGARTRLCILFVYGVAAAIIAVLFGVPAWQSRPLALEGGHRMSGFRIEAGGPVCDTATVDVTDSASVTYRLCTGRSHMVEVTARVRPEVDRDVVAHFELASGGAMRSMAKQCAFDVFDGVGVTRRKYSRWTPVPGNYYPAVSHVALASGDLTLHSRQATGATCIAANTLEVGMHRSMSGNDFRGLDEPVIDDSMASITHFVDTGMDRAPARSGLLANAALNAPALAFLMAMPDSNVSLAAHSGLGAAGDDKASSTVHNGCVRFVGIQRGRRRASDGLDIYARVQLLAGDARCLDEHGAGVINVPGLLAVGPQQRVDVYAAEPGDWSIGEWQHQRLKHKVERAVSLLPGAQALFQFEVRSK